MSKMSFRQQKLISGGRGGQQGWTAQYKTRTGSITITFKLHIQIYLRLRVRLEQAQWELGKDKCFVFIKNIFDLKAGLIKDQSKSSPTCQWFSISAAFVKPSGWALDWQRSAIVFSPWLDENLPKLCASFCLTAPIGQNWKARLLIDHFIYQLVLVFNRTHKTSVIRGFLYPISVFLADCNFRFWFSFLQL